jgi:FkbM family methyltransferase
VDPPSPSVPSARPPEFAENEVRVFSLLRDHGFQPRVIYDIGAANGTWSALVSEVFPDASFHLFEPLAEIHQEFRGYLDFHMRNHPAFFLHTIALGAGEGEVEMRLHEDGYSSTIFDMGTHPEYQRRIRVPQHTLDGYIVRSHIPLPDIIKLDTQGAERVILQESSVCLQYASLVFAETWLTRGYGPETPLLPELMELLSASNFTLADLGHRFYDGQHALYGCDAFFLKTDLLQRIAPAMPAYSW